MGYSVAQIAEHIGGEVKGDGSLKIDSIASLRQANSSQLSFLSNAKFVDDLHNTGAGCVILSEKAEISYKGNTIIVKDAYVGFALASQLLDTTPHITVGIAATASVAPSATLGKNVAVADGAVISAHTLIGDDCEIGANVFIGEGARLGNGVKLSANVSIYHKVQLGDEVSIHSGSVIGSDGFGYANDAGNWIKIPQTGSVQIGERTEIGANTCIDRGALDDTIVGKNCIIDNLVHIAHNVVIGDHVCLCGGVGIAGSATIGKYVVIAGQCAINGHITIADGVQITGFSMVTKSIKEKGTYSSGMPAAPNKDWQRNTVKLRTIDKLYNRVKAIENEGKS
ncbi:UDP-3-O-(3-hydroxymyristoyl)glucosamine N-acyltransferase [Agaribacter marinus]|uniref:UDP-3-O-acylglucosamine N-acyltransferase n=1 Tax=Agaribacter marinus TaxID=1431249 RepID=A0AA37T6A8_9ALTE|nr:UDP-3-O-(3-hydroxymyristoyl)glucosamine N-acyltransferase [Agaribacter marinus]GLR73058.1 UDP-3-O-acylglucosamine N-acyltransferase [Agaribacter marinus]